MTRKIIYLILPLFLLVFVSTVNAQNTTTGSAQTTVDTASKLKQQMQLLQEQKKAAMTKVKEEAKAMVQAKRDEFKTRIQTIKDQKKKALVERIDAKLAQVNKNHTAKFTEVLTRLQAFLDKANESATGITVLADVASAQSAIDAAKIAVEAQAAKTYTMTITDDSALRANAGTTVSQLRLDLMAVHKLVVDAKQAVQKLKTDKVMMKKEATGSANL